ncbi:hypothetical protein D0T50_06715 [Bacteroides sp. 214]|nr:hypothetical protein [Bacteroides sp. 214]
MFGQTYQEYKTPTIVRSSFDLLLQATGSYEKQRTDYYKTNSHAFAAGPEFAFVTYKETSSSFTNHTFLLGAEFGKYRSKEKSRGSTDRLKANTTEVAAAYSLTKRFYFEKNAFFGTGGGLTLQYENYNLRGSDYSNKNTLFQAMLPLEVGSGRLKHVTEVYQAAYLLKELAKKNALKRELTTDEELALAQVMATAKNKRFLNSGKLLTEEVAVVDSFLQAKNLLTDDGSAYTTTLNNVWKTSALFERRAGTVFSAGMNTYYHYMEAEEWKEETDGDAFSFNPFLLFQYEKPMNLRWQHSIAVSPNAMFTKMDNIKNRYFALEAMYQLGFYPTQRTNINLAVAGKLLSGKQIPSNPDRWNPSKKITETSIGISLTGSHYITPHLRVTAQINGSFDHQKQRPNGTYTDYKTNLTKANYVIAFAYVLY